MAEEADVLRRLGARVCFTSKKTYGRDGVPVHVIFMNFTLRMRKKTDHTPTKCIFTSRQNDSLNLHTRVVAFGSSGFIDLYKSKALPVRNLL